jgi:hypothetical protein
MSRCGWIRQKLVLGAEQVLDQMKYEIASKCGVNLSVNDKRKGRFYYT